MESIRGGCGVPSHVQHHLFNFRAVACDDCSRQVRTASEGYYFCSQCDTKSCVSCTFNKQSQQGSKSNSNPASSSRSTAFSTLQIISDSDDDDDELEEEMEEPILPCAGSFTHKLEFLQNSPYSNNSFGCNMCGQAGYGKVYHCDSCMFDAHTQCAEVEEQIKVFYHKHTLQRYFIGDEEDDDEEFKCQCCQGYVEEDVSDWVYKCLQCDDFAVHARCAKYAQSLTHGSHPHKLKLVNKSSKGKYRQFGCDACAGEICHTYFYTCTKGGCDFDLHPLCAVLPSKPLCRIDPTHRVDVDFFTPADELCVLCESPSNEAWLYRCIVCQVSMHVDCFGAETDGDSSDEEDDEEGEEEDFGELYQKFIDSMDDFGNEDDKDKVDMLSELVDSYKSSSEAAAASSFARQNSVKSKVQPKNTLTRTGTHIGDREIENKTRSKNSSSPQYYPEDNPRSTYSPGDDSSLTRSSESDARDAEEVERRRVKRAAKEQRQKDKAAEKEQEKKEKEARRAERAQRESKALAQLEHVTMELQRIKLSGGNDTAVAELKALTGNWQAQFATQHKEEVKRSEERHLETVKLHHGLGKLQQERHLQSTNLHREQLEQQKEQAKLQDKRHLEHTNLLQQQKQEYLNGLQEIIRTQVQSTTRVVPRLVLCTETKSKMKKVLTSLRVGIKGVHLHLFCEYEQQPHVVAGAQGCEINQKVAGDRWTNLQPFLVAGLKVLMMALHMGVSVGTPGVGLLKVVVPDLPKIVQETLALDLGRHGLQTYRGAIVPRPEEEEAAAQWLVCYLREQKVNIGECFKLHRVRYNSPRSIKGNVGWLCSTHLEEGRKAGCLERFPVS